MAASADGSFTIPWVRGFVIVTDHPFFAVPGGKAVEVDFTYDGTEPEPDENKDELRGLW
jgi:hypothetical protein